MRRVFALLCLMWAFYLCATYAVVINSDEIKTSGVELNQKELNLQLYDFFNLEATVLPSDASNKNLSWTSSLPSRISVDADGGVSVSGEGEAFIVVETEDGGFRDTCFVTCEIPSADNIIAFELEGQRYTTIDESQHMITVNVPFGTDVSNLSTSFQVSPGATISPDPTSVRDYTSRAYYRVTSKDQTTKSVWIVTVKELPDLSNYQEYTLKFDESTIPSSNISSYTEWFDKDLRIAITNADNITNYISAGFSDNALGLYPAQLIIDGISEGMKVVALEVHYKEYCGQGCTMANYYIQEGDSMSVSLPSSGDFIKFLEPFEELDSVGLSSYEAMIEKVTLWMNVVNYRPVAEAGNDTTAYKGAIITLKGDDSYDQDQDELTYKWTVPEAITSTDTTQPTISFTLPTGETEDLYQFILEVSDGALSTVDTVNVFVNNTNRRPIAEVVGDSVCGELSRILLDASSSIDLDGDQITFRWHLAQQLNIIGSDSASAVEFDVPEVIADSVINSYLVVSDAEYNDTVFFNITVKDINKAPIAIASSIDVGFEGDTIVLSGIESYDPEGDEITYSWFAPDSVLYNEESSIVTCVLPEVQNDTVMQYYLNVFDNENAVGIDTVVIAIKNINKQPTPILEGAEIRDHIIILNRVDSITLDASGSYDPDGTELSYKWQVEGADIIAGSDTESTLYLNAKWIALEGFYNASLTVSDGELDSTLNFIVRVKYENHQPIANAGSDINGFEGDTLLLNGSYIDVDNDIITYNWESLNGAVISNITSSHPTIILPEVDQVTTFMFRLVVSDEAEESDPDTVKVTAYPIKAFVKVKVRIDDTIIDPSLFSLTMYKKEGSDWLIKNPDVFTRFEDMSCYLMEPGEWILNVIPSSEDLGFITTYYGDVIDWEHAKSIVIAAQEEIEIVINCQSEKIAAEGNGTIGGVVYKVGTQLKAVSVLDDINNPTMSDVRVFLYSSDNDILLSSTISDENGAFEFVNLPEGGYYVEVELPGYDQARSLEVKITEDASEATGLDFSVKEDEKIIADVDDQKQLSLSVYPNPTANVLNIETGSVNMSEFNAIVIDLTGKVVIEETALKDKCHINISALKKGVYILQVWHNKDLVYLNKILKK